MRYLSVCSGIEAATVAWEPLGWTPLGFSEIAPFPAAVLAHRWPGVPNFGSLLTHHDWPARSLCDLDLLVGGTPCQSFSVAGLRQGLADPRGNLALVFLALVAARQPRWVLWENVPGVLSSNGGRDFGALLGALAQLGYGWAYRVLDAQYYGVAQRRRRVFLVGHTGGAWQRAAAVLFEPESLRGDPPPGRGETEDPAPAAAPGTGNPDEPRRLIGHGCFWNGEPVTQTLDAVLHKGQCLPEKNRFPAVLVPDVVQAVSLRGREGGGTAELGGTISPALRASSGGGDKPHVLCPVAFHGSQDPDVSGDVTHPVGRNQGQETCVLLPDLRVRRLTPRECERLQGFPDDHTLIPYRGKPAADGPRYKAIGNSIATPVLRWLARRMLAVEQHLPA